MHSFEVENLEEIPIFKPQIPNKSKNPNSKSDWIFNIDILPNRAHDAVGHIGVAREVAALVGGKLKLPKFFNIRTTKQAGGVDVEVKDAQLCTRYMAAVARDVGVGDSPSWLRERLEALGLNSINNVVDAANYAMLVTGQPLHAFDLDKLQGKKLVVRKAKKGEKITTLDDETYNLSAKDLVIADSKNVLAIAGIKGGKIAEVDKNTKNLVLESANFNALSIRNTARSLGIATDASYRFEHEIPLSFAEDGLGYLMQLLQEVAEGKPQKQVLDIGRKTQRSVVVAVRPAYASSLLGEKLTAQKIERILKSLEFGVHTKAGVLHVKVPVFRMDIEREEDLVEEIGRIRGYENIKPEMPVAALYPPKRDIKNYWTRQIKKYLASRGFNELYNYSFVAEDAADIWGFNKNNLWELENPLNLDFKYLRPNLIPGTLQAARENLKNFTEIQTFEVGEVFIKQETNNEQTRLCLAIAAKAASAEKFYELKGYAESMFNALGISDIWFDDAFGEAEKEHYSYLHPARRAQIKLADDIVGIIGQINPRIADNYDLRGSLFVAELEMDKIINAAEKENIYTPVSQYPQVVRDISVLAPTNAKTSVVMEIIDIAGGELLRDVDMFDYYEQEPAGERSMAFHLIFQSDERTLKSEEVDKLMQKIIQELEKNGWEIK